MTNVETTVKHELAIRMRQILQEECIDNIEGSANTKLSTKANIVGIRKVVGDFRIALTVQNFHPIERDAWSDEAVPRSDSESKDGTRFPSMTVGGRQFYRLRMAIEVNANLTSTNESTEDANMVIQEVIARVRWAIKKHNKRLAGISDKYGVTTIKALVVGDTEYDSGAETSNISRSWIRVSIISSFH